MKTTAIVALLGILTTPALYAEAPRPAGGEGKGPCKQVADACAAAGFVVGGVKEGKGMYAQCVGPLVSGKPAKKPAAIPLPNVPADVLAACRQKQEARKEKH